MELEKSVVYGPVNSRRFGWDLGINLLPLNRKLCTFDCIYCQYGYSPPLHNEQLIFPNAAEIITAWQASILQSHKNGLKIQHTTVSGNGEPTMHPHFAQIVKEIARWRDQHAPEIKLALLSNGYRLHDPQVRKALAYFDEPIIKLDTGSPEKLASIDHPLVPYSLPGLIANLQKCKHIIIQTMFVKGWNDSFTDVLTWQNALLLIRPQTVQIYTVSRDTALAGLAPLGESELLRIAESTARLLGVPVVPFL